MRKIKSKKNHLGTDFTKAVMSKIQSGEIKMRPKAYFIAGTIATFTGLVFSVITSVYFVGLTRFIIRSQNPMKQFRLEQMISSFPWWIPFVAIISIVFGIYFLRKYDFSYKKNFFAIISGFIIAILVAGWIIDSFGINIKLGRKGLMRKFYQRQLHRFQINR